jgi:hypothetical protein
MDKNETQNLAWLSSAITRDMPVGLKFRFAEGESERSNTVIRPHVLKYDNKMQDYYVLAGRRIFWLNSIGAVTLLFISMNEQQEITETLDLSSDPIDDATGQGRR